MEDLILTILEASERQIRAAISAFESGSYDTAVILGSAAEGILPAPDARTLFVAMKEHAGVEPNPIANWLKHGNGTNGQPADMATVRGDEAIVMIIRAISKYRDVSGDVTAFAGEFGNYIRSFVEPEQ